MPDYSPPTHLGEMAPDNDATDFQSTPQWLRSGRRLFGPNYPGESPAKADARGPSGCYEAVSSGEVACASGFESPRT